MEDLNTMMETLSIEEINQKFNNFVHSAQNNGNKVKLSFLMLNMLQECSRILGTVNTNDFITEVRESIVETEKRSKALCQEYHTHISQNKDIQQLLSNERDSRIADIQRQISSLLSEYDNIIKQLVNARDRLPIETQMEIEKR